MAKAAIGCPCGFEVQAAGWGTKPLAAAMLAYEDHDCNRKQGEPQGADSNTEINVKDYDDRFGHEVPPVMGFRPNPPKEDAGGGDH